MHAKGQIPEPKMERGVAMGYHLLLWRSSVASEHRCQDLEVL